MTVQACVLVGGGPGGTAMLLAAARTGRLDALCAAGLTIVERGDSIGAGRLGGYAITSDSTAETFLTSVRGSPVPALAALVDTPEAHAIETYIGALGVPLPIVGAFLDRLGATLAMLVAQAGGTLLFGHELLDARRGADGLWHARVRRLSDGAERTIASHTIVGATGGHQPVDRLARADVAGQPLVARWGATLIQSDTLLALPGLDEVRRRLAGKARPRIAIVGGSTSAVTSAIRLLSADPSLGFGEGGLTLLHREPLRPFFPSAQAARDAGYTDFDQDDICPVSGFVYRLGGFRLEARDLVCRTLGIEGVPDPRLRRHRLTPGDDAAAVAILDEADLVVAALGYVPYGLPLHDVAGRPYGIAAEGGMVDERCRLRSATGKPIPDAFALGLAAGFRPSGALGGEKSFRGQANGLWLWQNDVGAMIAEQALAAAAHESEDAARAVA